MGATANERQAINQHVNRNDLDFIRVAADEQRLKGPRWKVTVVRRRGEEIIFMSTLKFFGFDFAYKMREALSEDWDEAILDRIERV